MVFSTIIDIDPGIVRGLWNIVALPDDDESGMCMEVYMSWKYILGAWSPPCVCDFHFPANKNYQINTKFYFYGIEINKKMTLIFTVPVGEVSSSRKLLSE